MYLKNVFQSTHSPLKFLSSASLTNVFYISSYKSLARILEKKPTTRMDKYLIPLYLTVDFTYFFVSSSVISILQIFQKFYQGKISLAHCHGSTLAGCGVPTRPSIILTPQLDGMRENVGQDKERERPITNYCCRQKSQLGKIDLIFCQSNQSRIMRKKNL